MTNTMLCAAETLRIAPRRLRANPRINPEKVHAFVDRLIGDDHHAKRVLSVANAVVGVLHAAALAVHCIGRGLAAARGLDPKHATKQVDRLLSNTALTVASWFPRWIRFVVGIRKEIVVALDWTDFDGDDQSTIALYLVTNHGRATPLVWKSVMKSELKSRMSVHEDEVIETLHRALSADVTVTLLADRGFGSTERYAHLDALGFDYVIRFREDIQVEIGGEKQPARAWLSPSGRARKLLGATVTNRSVRVSAVVVAHNKKMKDAWCLATSLGDRSAQKIVALYGRRFTIEETFRDTKDIHFGMGLKATHIKTTERRERLLMLGAMAHALLTLLGAAGERCGLDRTLKVNTSKKRSLSLYRQGLYWYEAIPAMRDENFGPLMDSFDQIVREHRAFCDVFGII